MKKNKQKQLLNGRDGKYNRDIKNKIAMRSVFFFFLKDVVRSVENMNERHMYIYIYIYTHTHTRTQLINTTVHSTLYQLHLPGFCHCSTLRHSCSLPFVAFRTMCLPRKYFLGNHLHFLAKHSSGQTVKYAYLGNISSVCIVCSEETEFLGIFPS